MNIIRDASSTKESDASGSDSLSLAEASNGELDTSDSDDNGLIEVNKENTNSYKDWNLLDEHIKKNKMITMISKFMEGIISDKESLRLQQQMLFWGGEDYILNIAPRMTKRPFALSFDRNAEELSFPTIYYGQPKIYSSAIHVIPFMQVTSELKC